VRRRERARRTSCRRLADLLDESGHHPHRGRPGAVRRADRLHDILEDSWAAQHPTGTPRRPGQGRIGGGEGVEAGEILVQVEHHGEDGGNAGTAMPSESWTEHVDSGAAVVAFGDVNCPRSLAGESHRRDEPPRFLVDTRGREVGHTVRDECAPEVHWLSGRAGEG
jgi:hypothetical protein